MSSKSIRTGLVTAAAFIVLEMVLHGLFLSRLYSSIPSVWRQTAELRSLVPWMWLGQALFGFFFGVVYSKGFESGKGTVSQGLRYGLLMALMLGPVTGIVWYTVLPIPQTLGLAWGVGSAVQCILLGLVAGSVHK